MKDVNMYIYTEFTGNMKAGTGKYHVILEYMAKTKEGIRPSTLTLMDSLKDTTRNRLELSAVIKGLEHITVPCRICIYTASDYIAGAFKNKWIEKWLQNDFRSGNKPVKHEDLWRILAGRKEHEIIIVKAEKTPYREAQAIELSDLNKKEK